MVLCCICVVRYSDVACLSESLHSLRFEVEITSTVSAGALCASASGPRAGWWFSSHLSRLQTQNDSVFHRMCSFCPLTLRGKVQCLRSEARKEAGQGSMLRRHVVRSAGGSCSRCLPTKEVSPDEGMCTSTGPMLASLAVARGYGTLQGVGLEPGTAMPKLAQTKSCMLLLEEADSRSRQSERHSEMLFVMFGFNLRRFSAKLLDKNDRRAETGSACRGTPLPGGSNTKMQDNLAQRILRIAGESNATILLLAHPRVNA